MPTLEELTAVCNKIAVDVPEDATAESLTSAIKGATITATQVNAMNKAELKTLCDVLEITYDSNATNGNLKALINAKLAENTGD